MDRKCENCQFWYQPAEKDKAWGKHRGQCRVNAPAVNTGWPPSDADEWCGQFVTKPGHFPGMKIPEMSAKELAGIPEGDPPTGDGTIPEQAKEALGADVRAESKASLTP